LNILVPTMMTLAAPAPPPIRQPVEKKRIALFVIIYENFLAVERAEAFAGNWRANSASTLPATRKREFQFTPPISNIARITRKKRRMAPIFSSVARWSCGITGHVKAC